MRVRRLRVRPAVGSATASRVQARTGRGAWRLVGGRHRPGGSTDRHRVRSGQDRVPGHGRGP